MNYLTLNNESLIRWVNDNGDNTHNIDYDLNDTSYIIELGGYTGAWTQQMVDKYNPNVYIIEPVDKFYNILRSKFDSNNKIHLMNVGVGVDNCDGVMYLNNDGTSSNLINGETINIKLSTIDNILSNFNLSEVDLLQINIEGDEYTVLENMLETGTINRFKNIQIQFHLGVNNAIERRSEIRDGLILNGFNIKFDYPFVWESWCKDNI